MLVFSILSLVPTLVLTLGLVLMLAPELMVLLGLVPVLVPMIVPPVTAVL